MCAIDECPGMKLYCRKDGCNGTERTWDTGLNGCCCTGREERNSTCGKYTHLETSDTTLGV